MQLPGLGLSHWVDSCQEGDKGGECGGRAGPGALLRSAPRATAGLLPPGFKRPPPGPSSRPSDPAPPLQVNPAPSGKPCTGRVCGLPSPCEAHVHRALSPHPPQSSSHTRAQRKPTSSTQASARRCQCLPPGTGVTCFTGDFSSRPPRQGGAASLKGSVGSVLMLLGCYPQSTSVLRSANSQSR